MEEEVEGEKEVEEKEEVEQEEAVRCSSVRPIAFIISGTWIAYL